MIVAALRSVRRWRRVARAMASLFVVAIVIVALLRTRAGALVCSYTNEVIATCCCAAEGKSPGPAIERPCCCRTMIVGELPQVTQAQTPDTNVDPPASHAIALIYAPVAPAMPSPRPHFDARETGPPLSAPERLARLSVLHL